MKLALALLVALALCASIDAKLLAKRSSVPKGWTRTARAMDLTRVKFIVALQQRNLDTLEKTFWAVSDPESPQYQQFMSISEILSIVAPSKKDHDTVSKWLTKGGATIIKDMGDALEAHMSVHAAEKLFSTAFYQYRHEDGRRVIRQWGEMSIPSHLDHLIHMVSGLTEFPVPHYKLKRYTVGNSTDGTLTVVPGTVYSVYQSPTSFTPAANSSQGVIEFEDQYFSPTDLQSFAQNVGVTIPAVDPSRTIGTNDPSAPGDEAELDIQYVGAVGLNIQNWFWIEADQCEDGIGASECQQLGVNSQGFVARVNSEFQKIGLRGVSILVASGDSGANGRTDEYCTEPTLLPDYPAASPYVTSVGATEIHNPVYNLNPVPPACNNVGYACASGGTEAAVSYAQSNFASGGGFSNVAAQPSYQSSVVSAYLSSGVALPPSSYYNATSRGYPDVAAFGSGILIYDGGLVLVGGTSASSPIVAGIASLLNDYSLSATGKPLGFLNPLLYKMYAASPSAFTDITVGDNKCTESGCSASCQGFLAAPGWDPVTGLGSPVYPQMLAYLKQMFTARNGVDAATL